MYSRRPRGRRIAFFSFDVDNTSLAQSTSSLMTIDLASRALTRLVRIGGGSARPRRSPDGRRIVFHSRPPAGAHRSGRSALRDGISDLYDRADGSGLTPFHEQPVRRYAPGLVGTAAGDLTSPFPFVPPLMAIAVRRAECSRLRRHHLGRVHDHVRQHRQDEFARDQGESPSLV